MKQKNSVLVLVGIVLGFGTAQAMHKGMIRLMGPLSIRLAQSKPGVGKATLISGPSFSRLAQSESANQKLNQDAKKRLERLRLRAQWRRSFWRAALEANQKKD